MKSFLLTLIVGVFFFIGMIIPKFIKNKDKLVLFATGLTFLVMFDLILFDLIPEINEIYEPLENTKYILLIVIFVALGILSLKLLDFFIPEHIHHHKEGETNLKEHNNHLYHIGFITAISLIIHNILEGITIYISGVNDFKVGILMAITVGLHNLPLGMEIAVNMNSQPEKRISNILIAIILIFSSCIGSLFFLLLNMEFNLLLEGILLSITLGMIIYITFWELLPEVREHSRTKEIKMGLIVGAMIAVVMALL